MSNLNLKPCLYSLSLIFTFFLIFSTALANENELEENAIDCNFTKDYLEKHPTNLKDLQKSAMDVGKETCRTLIGLKLEQNSYRDKLLEAFATQAASEFDKMFPDTKFKGISSLSKEWRNQIVNQKNDYRRFILITDQRGCPSEAGGRKCWEVKLPSEDWGQYQYSYIIPPMIKDHCSEIINNSGVVDLGGNDCTNALQLWTNAVAPFQCKRSPNHTIDAVSIVNLLQHFQTLPTIICPPDI